MLSQGIKAKRCAGLFAMVALLSFLACQAGAALAGWITQAACNPSLDLEPMSVRLRQSVLPDVTGSFIGEIPTVAGAAPFAATSAGALRADWRFSLYCEAARTDGAPAKDHPQ
jgi:hypothetical protein